MCKKEYLEQIEKALVEAKVNRDIINEVIEDYTEHFVMGIKNGKTEESICDELGNIEEIVEEIKSMNQSTRNEECKNETMADVIPCDNESDNSQSNETQSNDSDCNQAGPFSKLEVEGVCADIIVRRGDVFKVDYTNNGSEKEKLAYQFYHYQEGDIMYVGVRENFRKMLFRIFHSSNIVLSIQLPTHVRDMKVNVASGDCRLEDIALDKLYIRTASGDILLNHVGCKTTTLDSSSGDIRIQNGTGDTMGVKSSSGDLRIVSSTYKDFQGNTSSGDIELDGGFIGQVRAQTASGDVESSVLSKDYYLKSISGDVTVRMNEDASASYESISGDISIHLNNNQNGYILNASTVSGDVDLAYANMYQSDCKSGCYTYGNQGSQINAKTVSGDISLKG